jgi:chromosome transmission fidelity protein 1
MIIPPFPEKGKRCEFLPSVDEPERLEDFRDHALSQVHSIEDLEDLGRDMKVCPYYGSRKAIKHAQLVTLPYNLLLLKQARESLGINLKEWAFDLARQAANLANLVSDCSNIVIVDEAHNLIE